MLSLAYDLKETVEIDGVDYNINLSFDNVLRLIDMIKEKELNEETKVRMGLEMLLGVCFLIDIEKQDKLLLELFESVLSVSERDQPVDIEGNPMPSETGDKKKDYCLTQDADYIYASFMQDYNIDLVEQQGVMHWDKFNALLNGLTENTKFSQVVSIRTMELPKGKGTSEERKRIMNLKRRYALEGTEIIDDDGS